MGGLRNGPDFALSKVNRNVRLTQIAAAAQYL
jgi:hypothetical protein